MIVVSIVAVCAFLLGFTIAAMCAAAGRADSWNDDQPVDYQLTSLARAAGVLKNDPQQ